MRVHPFLAGLAVAALSVAAGLVDSVPFDHNRLLVASPESVVLYEFDEDGVLQPTLVTGLASVHDLAFGPGGVLYATDVELDEVLCFDASGQSGTLATGLNGPTDIAFGPGGFLYVANSEADEVVCLDRFGDVVQSFGAGSGLDDPRGIAFGADGHLFVTSFGTGEVLEFDASGALIDVFGDGILVEPYGIAFGPLGRIFVASHGADEVLAFDSNGAVVISFGAGTGVVAPTAIAFGPGRRLYVASEGTDDVRVIHLGGNLVDTIGEDTDLTSPTGLAFTPFVFGAALKLRTVRPGLDDERHTVGARLSFAPGTTQVAMLLVDAHPDVIDLLGSDVLVFEGRQAWADPIKKGAHFIGTRITGSGLSEGLATLAIEFKGSLDEDGRLVVKKFGGDLSWSGPAGSLAGPISKRSKLP